jgi:serine/threonine protein kinase
MAPEIFDRDYHWEADMWSLGIMLYQLYARRFPFWRTYEECRHAKLDEVAALVAGGAVFQRFCLTSEVLVGKVGAYVRSAGMQSWVTWQHWLAGEHVTSSFLVLFVVHVVFCAVVVKLGCGRQLCCC